MAVTGTDLLIIERAGVLHKATVAELPSGGSVAVQDEGVSVTTALAALNFTGAGVTVTGGATAVVNIPGGGGGGSYDVTLGWAF
jgi:hypothetical protein